MIERIVSLGAQYLSTVGALARTEAEQDLARWTRVLRARLAGALVLATGVLWLNVAVLLWLLTTPYALAGAVAIAAVGIVAGLVMSARARREAGSLNLLEGTRRVLADELGVRAPLAQGAPPPRRAPHAPMPPTQAVAQLHEIRQALRDTVALHRGSEGAPLEPAVGPRFESSSRTMRSLMWLWRAIPRVPASTALFSAFGVLAVSSPRLRRLVAVVALLRNLGGHPRPAGHESFPSYPSFPS